MFLHRAGTHFIFRCIRYLVLHFLYSDEANVAGKSRLVILIVKIKLPIICEVLLICMRGVLDWDNGIKYLAMVC